MDFEHEFIDELGQFFWPGCRTVSAIMCKKNFTKIFTNFFSRIVQSQNFERHRNLDFFYLNIIRFWCLIAQKKANIEFYENDNPKNNIRDRKIPTRG